MTNDIELLQKEIAAVEAALKKEFDKDKWQTLKERLKDLEWELWYLEQQHKERVKEWLSNHQIYLKINMALESFLQADTNMAFISSDYVRLLLIQFITRLMKYDVQRLREPMNYKAPCTGRCTPLADVCHGCGRTLEQQRDWNSYSEIKQKRLFENFCQNRIMITSTTETETNDRLRTKTQTSKTNR